MLCVVRFDFAYVVEEEVRRLTEHKKPDCKVIKVL